MSRNDLMQVQDLEHLGIVAGVIDQIQREERVNESLAWIIHDDFGKSLKAFQDSRLGNQSKKHTVFRTVIVMGLPVIDELFRLGKHPQQKVSPGQGIKAMLLNGLGFVSAPLYLYEGFFQGKATRHLLGEGVEPEQLNDDYLGCL